MKKKKISKSEGYEVVPIDEEAYFYSFDLGLATALITAGFSLVSLDRQNLRKVQFVFRRAEGLDEVINAYWEDTLEGKLRTYFDTQKMLKNRLYSE